MHDDEDDRNKQERATARGEHNRALIVRCLREDGPQDAADLLPAMPREVSLSEVAFQLERLREEGHATGKPGGAYRPL